MLKDAEEMKKRRAANRASAVNAGADIITGIGSGLLGAASFGTNLVMPYLKGLEANALEQYNSDMGQMKSAYSGDKGFMKLGGMIRKYPMGGQVPYEQDTPIQTEKGEAIISDTHIYNVKAKKKHEQMDEEKVTDILKAGDFVVSDRKEMKIDRALADHMIVGQPMPFYSEHMYSPMEDPHTLGDMFGNHKKLTPAQLAKRIKQRYPLTDREHDALANHANEFNLNNRRAYLEALKQANVDNIPKAEEAELEQMIEDERGEVPEFKHGGGVDPIKPYVTNNPNDPRIQAYRDSSDLYNYHSIQRKEKGYGEDYGKNVFTKKPGEKGTYLSHTKQWREKERRTIDNMRKDFPEIPAVNSTDHKLWDMGDSLISKNKNFYWDNEGTSPDLMHKKIKPIKNYFSEADYAVNAEYKKPRQEVIYRENTPPLDPLNTLQPQQIDSPGRGVDMIPTAEYRKVGSEHRNLGARPFLDGTHQKDIMETTRVGWKRKDNYALGGLIGGIDPITGLMKGPTQAGMYVRHPDLLRENLPLQNRQYPGIPGFTASDTQAGNRRLPAPQNANPTIPNPNVHMGGPSLRGLYGDNLKPKPDAPYVRPGFTVTDNTGRGEVAQTPRRNYGQPPTLDASPRTNAPMYIDAIDPIQNITTPPVYDQSTVPYAEEAQGTQGSTSTPRPAAAPQEVPQTESDIVYSNDPMGMLPSMQPVPQSPSYETTGASPYATDDSINRPGEFTGTDVTTKTPLDTSFATTPKPKYDGEVGIPDKGDFMEEDINNRLGNLDKNYQAQLRDINTAKGAQMGYLGLGTIGGVIGTFLQDSQFRTTEVDTRYRRAMPRRVPQSVMDSQSNRINQGVRPMQRAALENSPYFNKATMMTSTAPAAVANAQTDLSNQNALQNLQLESTYLQGMDQAVNQQNAYDAQAANQTAANANEQIAQGAGYFVNASNQMAALTAATQGSRSKALASRNMSEQILLQNKLQYEELRRLYGK